MKNSLFSLRLFIKGIAIILLILMFLYTAQNSVVISKGNEKIQSHQLETLTKVLATQAALSASDMIANNDQVRLLKLTDQLAKEKLVFDATIYDAEGVKLASSENAVSAREILGLDTPLETASIGRLQLVEPVFHDNAQIGYVRITFEKGRVTAFSDHHYRNSDRYMYTMILMGFASGLLLAMILRRKRKPKGENLLLKQAK
ncbi:YtjB family periplasmic protein [Vibrio sp. JC009]|uniref:YtjB family periplasmic protein n=1 Tax=Vibrio sp. JC009 TaxID=2912314 RepID=UPI0023B12648|nr:YtjB family periplasmic protein [Vibrio sp. JC009]WED21211.1 YtjB family periplasmic protein [Vibrio sp. JC009]